jgi:hypothetical protein
MQALGAFGVHTTGTPILFSLGGKNVVIQLSPVQSHFADINVIGTDFLFHTKAELYMNYDSKKASITLHT